MSKLLPLDGRFVTPMKEISFSENGCAYNGPEKAPATIVSALVWSLVFVMGVSRETQNKDVLSAYSFSAPPL